MEKSDLLQKSSAYIDENCSIHNNGNWCFFEKQENGHIFLNKSKIKKISTLS